MMEFIYVEECVKFTPEDFDKIVAHVKRMSATMTDIDRVEAFIANLVASGFSRERAVETGYDYALSLQTDQLPEGAHIRSDVRVRASLLVRDASKRIKW